MAPIVYIDDEVMLCRVFQRILEGRVPEVLTFTDPFAAIAYIRAHPVAAIVCDYRMPELSGLDLLDRIDCDVPFFLVSGDLGIAAMVRDNPRVTNVLTKPFRVETLLTLITEVLSPGFSGGETKW